MTNDEKAQIFDAMVELSVNRSIPTAIAMSGGRVSYDLYGVAPIVTKRSGDSVSRETLRADFIAAYQRVAVRLLEDVEKALAGKR